MTKAMDFRLRWVNSSEPCHDPAKWAREVDAKARVEGYLWNTGYMRFVFSDGSQATLTNGMLIVDNKGSK